MKIERAFFLILAVLAVGVRTFCQEQIATPLPEGVKAVWDVSKAQRETTETRERICLNGLWRWQPSGAPSAQLPESGWGYFKVPGSWPGITDYMQKDSQTVFAHPNWKSVNFANLNAAWYQREITVPAEWHGRRISVSLEYLNSFAELFVDGKKAGEVRFPAGEVDLTAFCKPGATHLITILVTALPLKAVMLSYTDSAAAREVKGSVPRRGLCGDVYLVSEPSGPRLGEIKVETSVRKVEFHYSAGIKNLPANTSYTVRARVMDHGRAIKEFATPAFRASELKQDRVEFTEKWLPEKLWDTDTPQNIYTLELSLFDSTGSLFDTHWATRFGFREFWIEGRDFFLNGTRIHLSAVPLDNAQIGAALSTYQAARESLERLQSIGINFVYTHNYDCEPGSHLSFSEILRAADDTGMLVALTQPHFSHYDWKSPEADATNGYAVHAAFYSRVAEEHPSVVLYAMSHNATGYEEDMNPDLLDGLHDPRDTWSARNSKLALRAEAIVHAIDPGRIVYHHASGNLGSMHVMNFYPNFVPVQELSDWFGHWSAEGVKPAFMCEYGAPFTWDWTMYRGWYKGQREFGSAKVPWEFCVAEWNAQFFGDRAYAISEPEKANLRWEAKQFRAGNLWHRWDYPNQVGSSRFEERYPVFAMYLTDNWRAFRTWGVSGISPWEYEHFWKLRDGVNKRREEFKVDWENLQRPGFSPDYRDQQYERMDLAFERKDWIATPAADALMRNNQPLLAYLGGKRDAFTSKDHVFLAGETVEKQLILINNSRQAVTGECNWSLGLSKAISGHHSVTVKAGEQERIPLTFPLPKTLAAGSYALKATVRFSNGETQNDSFVIQVLPQPTMPKVTGRIALFDPKGETAHWLNALNLQFQSVDAAADLSAFDCLIVGKAALTVRELAPDISRVREGLKVIIFEQTGAVLEKRFGFRVAEYGLRQAFARVPDHPALNGIALDQLRDWRGAATILPAHLDYTIRPRFGPTVNWCDIPVPRIWRCGNRGNLASALIEKPACGNFLPILDGGYGLQYSPLMEYREGRGMILFCQMDVTGRTESDPVAETLGRNLFQYISNWKPSTPRVAVYVGEPEGKRHLESAGFTLHEYNTAKLNSNEVLIVGPSGGRAMMKDKAAIADWLKAGGHLLALGLDQENSEAFLSMPITFKKAEHISTFFEPNSTTSVFKGIGPADLHNRDPREFSLITGGAKPIGDGMLGTNANITVCQLLPWQFDPTSQSNLKRTYRRASFALTRLLSNLDVPSSAPILARFHTPVEQAEKRFLRGLYLDQPEEWDDPYRFFRW